LDDYKWEDVEVSEYFNNFYIDIFLEYYAPEIKTKITLYKK